MPRTLFLSARSPFARKVHLLLLEKSLPFEKHVVDLTARTERFVAISPLGKVPVLQDEDGTVIFDSTVIAEYLEDRYPEPPMFGRGVQQRLLHRQIEELGDTVSEQAIALFFDKDVPRVLDKARRLLDKAYAELEQRIARGQVPEEFGVGHASVMSALGYQQLRLGRESIEAHPSVERWLQPFMARRSVLAAPAPTE
jgi:glutathione S-transferase